MSCRNIITLILIAIPALNILSQGASETRSYMRSFPVKKESVLEVNNKYGKVEITTWKKDSVTVKAEIRASASNHSKAGKMFDEITIKITDAGNLILAQTIFNQSINAFLENFKGMTSKVINYDSQVEIDYYINVPEYINLRIDNRYGDVFLEKTDGNLDLTISNGDLKADVPGKRSNMNLSFCDATITSFIAGEIQASFSEVTIGDVKKINIKSISSKYRVNNAKEIDIESRRDDLYIDNIGSLSGDSYFTDFELSSLTKSVNLVTRYGNLDLNSIDKNFESVNINSAFSDVSIEFEPGASYKAEIRTQNTFLALPSSIKSEEKTLNSDKKEYMTTATEGSNPGTRILKIDANRGKIYVK
jgi:hypothetical protein